MNFYSLRILECHHTVSVLLNLAYSTSHNVFKVDSYASMCPNTFLFEAEKHLTICIIYPIKTISSQANDKLGCFHTLAIVKYCDEHQCKIAICVSALSYFCVYNHRLILEKSSFITCLKP